MTLIRQAFAAFLVWTVLLLAWAAVSHTTGFVGPARTTEASLGMVADALDALDPPAVLGAPQRFAADRIRSAAGPAQRVHGAIERAAGAFVDRLGHDRAHPRRDAAAELRATLDEISSRLNAQRIILGPDGRITVHVDTRVSVERNARAVQLETDANLDRDKVKKWIEKLLDLLEEMEASETR